MTVYLKRYIRMTR